MPLESVTAHEPEIEPSSENLSNAFAIKFTELHIVATFQLTENLNNRIACLSQMGVNLLMQRWVNHNTRVVIPTHEFQKQLAPVFEEADLQEDWCSELIGAGYTHESAEMEFETWIRNSTLGRSRQDCLKEDQLRSGIRQEMRKELSKRLSTGSDDFS